MTATVEINDPALLVGDDRESSPMTLIDRYLLEQQELTAVERFAQRHERNEIPLQSLYYESLLPASPPGPGEQYAFEVDLDACSGCKSCVVACNSLNGLDPSETWRQVGLLHGGTEEQPFLQHVTAACHHCLEPACLQVCPVRAYEKDIVTGIVKHLDDQCIGCQYCVLACPYDVPKYNASRGIVRKCDMCSSRLAANEAPACVQSCPNRAIRITTVRVQEVVENCEVGLLLPGAPDSHTTQPTTHYQTKRSLPRNALPADFYSVAAEHAHWPLVAMLVLTQLSVGAFLVTFLADLINGGRWSHTFNANLALAFGLVALGASTLHLGRPHLAFRAVLGLRTSWLSREIVAFGIFAALAVVYAAATSFTSGESFLSRSSLLVLGGSVVVSGLLGILCSVMIYARTGRRLWNGPATATRFGLTTVLLGLSANAMANTLVTRLSAASNQAAESLIRIEHTLFPALIAAAALKLIFESLLFVHLKGRQLTPLKRSALLLTGELAPATKWRFGLGLIAGIVVPAMWLTFANVNSPVDWQVAAMVVGQFVALVVGELLERYLFFAAAVAPSMPGGLRT